jgi:formylglycine-generating enzyme required for sulfatase activity
MEEKRLIVPVVIMPVTRLPSGLRCRIGRIHRIDVSGGDAGELIAALGGWKQPAAATRMEPPASPEPSVASSKAKPAPTYTNEIGMEFVLIPAGTFRMGSEDRESEKPVHEVRISKPFYMGTYPVTQGEWEAVIGKNPSEFKGTRRPVERVSWEEAQAFIRKLNEREDGGAAARYRLPSEAEWEYACRAGTTTRYLFGDDPSQLDRYGWYHGNASGETHPVGEKAPNAWGLYDMHGNVWEWVQDWYDKDYYGKSPKVDPAGPAGGSGRVLSGGCWYFDAVDARSAIRGGHAPGDRFDFVGFRVVRQVL